MKFIGIQRDQENPQVLTMTTEEPGPWYRRVPSHTRRYIHSAEGNTAWVRWCDSETLVDVGGMKHYVLQDMFASWSMRQKGLG